MEFILNGFHAPFIFYFTKYLKIEIPFNLNKRKK